MLNYIWAGLVIFSLVFALANDISDFRHGTYRNGQMLPVTIGAGAGDHVTVHVDPATYRSHFAVDESIAPNFPATLVQTQRGRELHFDADAPLPPRLAKIRDFTSADDKKWLLAEVTNYDANAKSASIKFLPVRWVALNAIGGAAIDMAKKAVTLSLELIGTLALFLGVMQIAEKSGLIDIVVKITGPILRPLFPGIPKGHPAMGMVTLNLTANMLGLGNAATPFGIKAMEELQKLNKTTDTATNAMVMLLAMNTAGVQLLPPMMLYAVLGLRASELYFPILIVTGLCLVIAVVSVRLLGLMPTFRNSDPDLIAAPAPAPEVAQ
jgi:spore maturation protein A